MSQSGWAYLFGPDKGSWVYMKELVTDPFLKFSLLVI